MWSLVIVLVLFIEFRKIGALSCYQCSMTYSNTECNSNNSTHSNECQPTYDTCVTIVLKPSNFDELIITKYCTKRKSCELQQNYTHSVTPCEPNNESGSWGCVFCCGERDLCNYNASYRLISSIKITAILFLTILLR